MGLGVAKGEHRLLRAIQQAIQSRILDTSIQDASQIIMSVMGGQDLAIHEVAAYGDLVKTVLDENCNVIFGVDLDPIYNDEVRIIIIATGFPKSEQEVSVDKAATPDGVNDAVSSLFGEMVRDASHGASPRGKIPPPFGVPPLQKGAETHSNNAPFGKGGAAHAAGDFGVQKGGHPDSHLPPFIRKMRGH
jgi:hypothetical protein